MTAGSVPRDERTVAVENSSYRLAYLFLAFGLLFATAYRSFVRSEQPWDLMAMLVASGALATLYQWRGRVLSRRWAAVTALAVVAAVLIAAALALLLSR